MLIARVREAEKRHHAHSQRDREADKGLLTYAPKDRECNALWTRFVVMVGKCLATCSDVLEVLWGHFGGMLGSKKGEDNSDVQKGPSLISI